MIYSPHIEPLTKLMDLYSRDRKAAFLQGMEKENSHMNGNKARVDNDNNGKEDEEEDDDFPVDPRLLLAPTLQTTRVRPWQVLPGRTHPVMTMRGGCEGYIFTARRVLPVEGKVNAKGNYSKKRKVDAA